MKYFAGFRVFLLSVSVLLSLTPAPAQQTPPWQRAHDPGPRPNPTSTIPSSVPGLSANEMALFTESLLRVSELEGTCDTCVQQPQGVLPIDPDPKNPFSPNKLINSAGMGPVFNADQCFTCHFQPTIGGSATRMNAAYDVAHRMGANNTVPAFEERVGPFREVRFKFGRGGERDGGVHSLFTVAGRSDVPGSCRLEQPDFAHELSQRNLAYRIPLQLFGLGLIEGIQDSAILANMRSDEEAKRALGIFVRFRGDPMRYTLHMAVPCELLAGVCHAWRGTRDRPLSGPVGAGPRSSTYAEHRCPKRMTIDMTLEARGVHYHSETEPVVGETFRVDYVANYDGKPAMVTGDHGILLPVTLFRDRANHVKAIYTSAFAVMATSERSISDDGRTMTITTVFNDAFGRKQVNVGVYHRGKPDELQVRVH